MKDRIEMVADILMGAAHTDSQLHGGEKQVIKQLLEGLISERPLPPRLALRIDAFSPKQFDLATTAAAFKNDSKAKKRALLQLVAAVNEADDEYDLDEDLYLRKVAAAIGLEQGRYSDLVLDVVEEPDLKQGLNDVRFTDS